MSNEQAIMDAFVAKSLEVIALKEANRKLLKALNDLEVSANTVSGCYSRNPGNFAAALMGLAESAVAARAAIAKAEGTPS